MFRFGSSIHCFARKLVDNSHGILRPYCRNSRAVDYNLLLLRQIVHQINRHRHRHRKEPGPDFELKLLDHGALTVITPERNRIQKQNNFFDILTRVFAFIVVELKNMTNLSIFSATFCGAHN